MVCQAVLCPILQSEKTQKTDSYGGKDIGHKPQRRGLWPMFCVCGSMSAVGKII